MVEAKEVPQPVVGGSLHGYLMLGLSALPVALAVFVGAPLISGDQEQGTAQLVTTQSVTRRQWLLAKLTWCYSLALLAAVPLGLLHTWYWEPHRSLMPHEWIEGAVFDSTGPMLPAFALFLTAVGVAVGLLTRRVFVAMTATFALALAVEMAWDRVRTELAPSRMFTYPLDTDLPPASPRRTSWTAGWAAPTGGCTAGAPAPRRRRPPPRRACGRRASSTT